MFCAAWCAFLSINFLLMISYEMRIMVRKWSCIGEIARQDAQTDTEKPTCRRSKEQSPRSAGLYAKTQVVGNPSQAINFRDKAPHWPEWTPPAGPGHRLHPSQL
ncbi:MAG: hypothetical protein QOD67_154 [Caballeronia sp.]|nr:hypothetical protein [Caballeronia sp.]